MAGTVFPPGTVGYNRIKADEAWARRERVKDVFWGVALAAILGYGLAVIAGWA